MNRANFEPAFPTDRPRITLKYAQTLDGRIATSTGQSRWISSPESRVLAHELRATHDAVLVGVGTVLADDPLLTVRHCKGQDPLRVVLDSFLRTPVHAALLADRPEMTILAASYDAAEDRARVLAETGASVLRLPIAGDGIDLTSLLVALFQRGLRSALVEGGAGLITSFWRSRLVDDAVIFIAPKISGAGLEAVGDLHIRAMDEAPVLETMAVDRRGDDLVVRGRPRWPETNS